MTMKKKVDKKPPTGLQARGGKASIESEEPLLEPKLLDKEKQVDLVMSLADELGTAKEIQDEFFKKTGMMISEPTIGKYLKSSWGKDFNTKKEEMKLRKSMMRKWKRGFENARAGIEPLFHKDYVSSDDGMFYNREDQTLTYIPEMNDTERAWRKGDIINFVKEKVFNYSPNEADPDTGSYNPSIKVIMRVQLMNRLNTIASFKYKKLFEKAFEAEREKMDISSMSLDAVEEAEKGLRVKVRNSLKKERIKLDKEAKTIFEGLMKQLNTEGPDARTKTLLGADLLNRNLDPAFASSSKKFRGKQRMLTLRGTNPETGKPYVFSRIVYNLPNILYNHSKRLQIMSHNLAKKLPELINGESPIVKAKFNDTKGVNLLSRLPKNSHEDILTREAGIVITKDAAKRFRYFNIVEENTLIAETVDQLPKTWRIDNPIKSYEEFVRRVKNIGRPVEIERGDPISMGGFKDLGGKNTGYTEAKHSGYLIFTGPPREKERILTVDPDHIDPSTPGLSKDKTKLRVSFITQDYQIVREDDLKLGDKIISRDGLKGVVADIVDTLGKDDKGKSYDAIINYGEIWREAEPNDPEFKLKEETYFKQGKKKSGVVLEHKEGDGYIYFFAINKMAQDQSTSGVRISTTMLSGMWEWFLYQVIGENKKYTQRELDEKLTEFVERYFGEKGTLIPSMKAMHYKAIKIGDKVRIEIDEREPTADEDGEVIYLPHTYAGRNYKYAYIPNFLSRIYFDGRTLREYYQINSKAKGPGASDWYWAHVVKQIKNRLYIFPKNEYAVNLVVVPYAPEGKEWDYMPVKMDAFDIINAGGDPYDPDLKITIRKEPVTCKESIQTHPVEVDFSGKYHGLLGLHPAIAVKATIDYDGDQITAFTPVIEHAVVKLSDEEEKDLKESIKKDKYGIRFEDLYKKAEKTKYASDETALGVECAKYNQETAEIENTMIQKLGGLRKNCLLFYGSKSQDPIKFGSTKDPRSELITPELINHVCDVEKVLKMKEPRWVVKKLEKTPWDDLTAKQKDLVRDYHIRLALGKRLQQMVDKENLWRHQKIIRNERTFVDEDDNKIDRSIDPINLEIDIGSGRLLDRIIWQQIKTHPEVLDEEK